MDIKLFNKNVKVIGTTGAKLDKLVHETAVGGLALVQADGNASRMDQLLKALPKGYRQQGFRLWVQAHSPIRWNGDEKVGLQKPGTKNFTDFNIEQATAIPFWDFTEENKPGTLSLDVIMAILKREADKLAKANENGDIVGDDGKVRYHIDGNVVELGQRLNAARAALATPVIAPPRAEPGPAVDNPAADVELARAG